MSRVRLWDVPVDVVDLSSAVDVIQKGIKDNCRFFVTTPNPEITYRSRSQPELHAALQMADLAVPDGIGLVVALRLLCGVSVDRVSGIDLAQALIEQGGLRFFLLGATAEVCEAAAEKVAERGGNVVGWHDGYFDIDDSADVVAKINQADPDILLVGMGSPRQELWLKQHIDELELCAITVGGTFDVLAGKVKRAPRWCQRLGLEWLYRVVTQPGRLHRLPLLLRFAFRVVIDWIGRAQRSD